VGAVANEADIKAGILSEKAMFDKKFERIYTCFTLN